MVERTTFPNPDNLRATAILDIENEAIRKLATRLLQMDRADIHFCGELIFI